MLNVSSLFYEDEMYVPDDEMNKWLSISQAHQAGEVFPNGTPDEEYAGYLKWGKQQDDGSAQAAELPESKPHHTSSMKSVHVSNPKNFRDAWEYEGHDKNSYAYVRDPNAINLPKGVALIPNSRGGFDVGSASSATPDERPAYIPASVKTYRIIKP